MSKKNAAHELSVDCIYTALLQLMDTKPYSEITITDITKKAGVSRMAYYRNFTDKDDILLSRLKAVLRSAEDRLRRAKNLSEERIWKEITDKTLKDRLIEKLIQAGLLGKVFVIMKDAMMNTYSGIYHWDFSDEDTVLQLYNRLGSLTGYLVYIYDYQQNLSTDFLVKHLTLLGMDKEKQSGGNP